MQYMWPSKLDLTHVLDATALHAHNTLHTRDVWFTLGFLRITTGIIPRVRLGFVFISFLFFPLPVTPKQQSLEQSPVHGPTEALPSQVVTHGVLSLPVILVTANFSYKRP